MIASHSKQIISDDELGYFINARHASPHDRLGMHQVVEHGKVTGVVIRAFIQDAKDCSAVDLESGEKFPLKKLHNSGFFEGFFSSRKNIFHYKFLISSYTDVVREVFDPYMFLPTMSEFDCYLFGKGDNRCIYKKLGSHVCEIFGINGVSFCVWAPNACRVSVVGDFNNWDGRYNPMRIVGASGVWEIFIPGIENFSRYKYEIVGSNDAIFLKSDPYAIHCDGAPNNASIVYYEQDFKWSDCKWISDRQAANWQKKPVSIYELHIDSWRRIPDQHDRPLSYRELAPELTKYAQDLGFTHIEFMPVAEHPFLGSWGYQVTGFYAPTSRYGTPDDFKFLVDYLHASGIGVIIDWVPAHFPRDAFSLANFDGTCLYEHEDPRKGCQHEWGTLIFNYGRNEVKNFLIGSVLSWAEKFHIDGIRVDAVASMLYLNYARKDGEWLPNQYGGQENIEALEFLREMNDAVHAKFPGFITIAEESTSFGGVTNDTKWHGIGFDFKWNMGWMHDTLAYFSKDPIYRKNHHNQLTFGMLYQYSESFVNVFSHDEVVHGKSSMIFKMPGITVAEKAQHLRSLYAFMWAWPGKKTLFMGNEFGQTSEWQYLKSLDWHLTKFSDHSGVQRLIADLNKIYREVQFLSEFDRDMRGFEWICCDDCDNSVLSFIRSGETDKEKMIVVCNFTPVGRENYKIGVPSDGFWEEILNSDAEIYGGSGRGNLGGKFANNESFHNRPYSLLLYLPPLSVLFLKKKI